MDIDVWEVIDAAKTKPFGFMPFYPGPGLGGHCIPIDPFYLSWKARQNGFECRFIELAGQMNGHARVRRHSASPTRSTRSRSRSTDRACICSASPTRRDVNDMRESPALDIMELLARRGANVSYTDPYVPELTQGGHRYGSVPFDAAVSGGYDCYVVATDHGVFDYGQVARLPLVVDTRNAIKNVDSPGLFRL